MTEVQSIFLNFGHPTATKIIYLSSVEQNRLQTFIHRKIFVKYERKLLKNICTQKNICQAWKKTAERHSHTKK